MDFGFQGNRVLVSRKIHSYNAIPGYSRAPVSPASCAEGRGAGRRSPRDEPSAVPLSKLHGTAPSRPEATSVRGRGPAAPLSAPAWASLRPGPRRGPARGPGQPARARLRTLSQKQVNSPDTDPGSCTLPCTTPA